MATLTVTGIGIGEAMQARPTKSFSNRWRICILVAFVFLLR
jgi:hypothetical protein